MVDGGVIVEELLCVVAFAQEGVCEGEVRGGFAGARAVLLWLRVWGTLLGVAGTVGFLVGGLGALGGE